MTPEISEFSYGFALTNEIVGWAPLSAAPVFPSLIEEGRAGGGYDVKLDVRGIPLYLQFKRADCMTRRSAWEIRDYSAPLSLPFYRFKITETGKSDQHQLLLELDDGENIVFYAAPRFHELVEIDAAWNANEVASRSIFVAPNMIGLLDEDSHHVAYDAQGTFLCSEPKAIEGLTSRELVDKLRSRLSAESKPLREKIPELIDGVERARTRAEERAKEIDALRRGGYAPSERAQLARERRLTAIEPVPTRSARPLSGAEQQLRQLADTAAKTFNAQLVIVQDADE
jgi:hypothetical protein